MKSPLKTTSDSGFSLAEVAISVGILALVVLSYIGMLGTGMSNMSSAINRSTEGRITDSMLREVQEADWDSLDTEYSTHSSRTRYFDDQGSPVKSGSVNHIYTARLYFDEKHGGDTKAVELPGDEMGRVDRTSHLHGVIVRIANRPGGAGEKLLDDDDAFGSYREYRGTIVKLGKNRSDKRGSAGK